MSTASVSAVTTAAAAMVPPASSGSPAAATAVSTAVSTYRLHIIAIEVRLRLVAKLSATFDGQGRSQPRFAAIVAAGFGSSSHLRALLLQDCLAREANAVTLNGQDLHQHLVTFLKFIPHITYPVFGDLADVQQPLGSGQNLNERSKIS